MYHRRRSSSNSNNSPKLTAQDGKKAWRAAASGLSYPTASDKLSYVSQDDGEAGDPRRPTIHDMDARAVARRTTVRSATREFYRLRGAEMVRPADWRAEVARKMARNENIVGLAACGKRVVHMASGVEVLQDPSTPENALFGQTWSCDNAACPTCGPRQAEARGRQADAAVNEWIERHGAGTVLLVTNSVWHDDKSDLKAVIKIQKTAWQRARRTMRASGGEDAMGWRAMEVTLGGPNGSHPHTHALMFFPSAEAADDALKNWNGWFVAAVQKVAKSRRFRAPAYADPAAQDIRRVEAGSGAGGYVTKGGWSAAKEVALGPRKTGKGGGASILEALDRAACEGGVGPWSERYCELIRATS